MPRPAPLAAGAPARRRAAAGPALGGAGLAAALLLSACGGRVLPVDITLVTRSCETEGVRAQLVDPLANAAQLRFTVYGEGIDSFTTSVRHTLQDRRATLPGIPAGKDRRIVVEALASPGDVVVARGDSGPLDLTVDAERVALAIFLRRTDAFSPASGFDPARGCTALPVPRVAHTATVLADGRVLIAGGYAFDAGGAKIYPRTLDIYDPHTGELRSLPDQPGKRLELGRAYHTATAIAGTTKVIIAGGECGTDAACAAVQSAEVFDSAASTVVGPVLLRQGRTRHAAAMPARTGRLVLVGGYDERGQPLASTETFDPARGGFEDGPNLPVGRGDAAAVPLADGRVIIVGGWDGQAGLRNSLALEPRSTGAYDLSATTVLLDSPHVRPMAAAFNQDSVLVTGGFSARDRAGPSDYPYAAAGTELAGFGSPPGSLTTNATLIRKRGNGGLAALPDGTFLAGGGAQTGPDGRVAMHASADIIYPDGNQTNGPLAIRATNVEMKEARAQATWTLLPDGTVLVAGGLALNADGSARALSSLELFQPRYNASRQNPFR